LKNKQNFRDLYTGEIPDGSVLGINYSGMHDTSIALIDPTGKPLFCISLERISRVKQDGRSPFSILEDFPWEKICCTAISVNEVTELNQDIVKSEVHPSPRQKKYEYNVDHGKVFYTIIQKIPSSMEFVPHHMSHAAVAFWASGLKDSLCLIYDGGMSNENIFGGLYRASLSDGISPLDDFNAYNYQNITQIYTAVTAILGFTPLKHEGKITGLAALGIQNQSCKDLLISWMNDSEKLSGLFKWTDVYNDYEPPRLVVNAQKAQKLRFEVSEFTKEELAATVQELAEEHIVEILHNATNQGWKYDNICLAGGLFANVKINQRVSELGFKQLFVAPPMSDDGTALGAAWYALHKRGGMQQQNISNMYLGYKSPVEEALFILEEKGIRYKPIDSVANEIAFLLSQGSIVAMYQGHCEFGPRSLGNRSILASAADVNINISLNERLNRTEFMPFAPVVRMEDAELCFKNIELVKHACEFMTVTVQCTEHMKLDSPAVVHVDSTARPQLIRRETNPLVYEILSEYQSITGSFALINTSFNVHEEPIVCSVGDALKGFFESGLDYVYIEGAGLISLKDNLDVEKQYIKQKIADQLGYQKKLKEKIDQYNFDFVKINDGIIYDSSLLTCSTVEGFHTLESWGIWSSGKKSTLKIDIKETLATSVYVRIKFSIKVFGPLAQYSPVVKMSFGQNQIAYLLFRLNQEKLNGIELNFIYDGSNGDLMFECTHEDSPANHGSADARILSFGIDNFSAEIVEATEIIPNSEKILFLGAN